MFRPSFFTLILALGIVAMLGLPSTAHSQPWKVTPVDPDPDNMHLWFAVDYTQPIATPDQDRWIYPSFGLIFELPILQFEVRTPAPIALLDAGAGVINYLAGGSGNPPIGTSLNRGVELPLMINVMEIRLIVPISESDRRRFLIGPDYRFQLGLVRFEADPSLSEDGELPSNVREEIDPSYALHQVSLRMGLGIINDEANFDFALLAGNSFGSLAVFNPVFGAELVGWMSAGDGPANLYLRLMGQLQRIDYSGYEPVSFLDRPYYDTDFHRWTRHIGLTVGLTYSL